MNHHVEQVWLGAGLTQQHDDGRVRAVPGADVQRRVANLGQRDGQTALNVYALYVCSCTNEQHAIFQGVDQLTCKYVYT